MVQNYGTQKVESKGTKMDGHVWAAEKVGNKINLETHINLETSILTWKTSKLTWKLGEGQTGLCLPYSLQTVVQFETS